MAIPANTIRFKLARDTIKELIYRANPGLREDTSVDLNHFIANITESSVDGEVYERHNFILTCKEEFKHHYTNHRIEFNYNETELKDVLEQLGFKFENVTQDEWEQTRASLPTVLSSVIEETSDTDDHIQYIIPHDSFNSDEFDSVDLENSEISTMTLLRFKEPLVFTVINSTQEDELPENEYRVNPEEHIPVRNLTLKINDVFAPNTTED